MEKIFVIMVKTEFSPEFKCNGIHNIAFRDVGDAIEHLKDRSDRPRMRGTDPRFWETDPKLKNVPRSEYSIFEVEVQ